MSGNNFRRSIGEAPPTPNTSGSSSQASMPYMPNNRPTGFSSSAANLRRKTFAAEVGPEPSILKYLGNSVGSVAGAAKNAVAGVGTTATNLFSRVVGEKSKRPANNVMGPGNVKQGLKKAPYNFSRVLGESNKPANISQRGGRKSRKAKSRKAKSRKTKSRKAKSRKTTRKH